MSIKAPGESYLQFESNIVWLEDIKEIPYVREHFAKNFSRRKGKIKYQNYQVIGYSELETDAPNTGMNGCFARRVFWVAEHDHINAPLGPYKIGCPSEGVDPLTIEAKVMGETTPRAWGTELALRSQMKSILEKNPIAQWLNENIVLEPLAYTHVGKAIASIEKEEVYVGSSRWLYANYCQFCTEKNTKPISLTRFSGMVLDLCNCQLSLTEITKQRNRNGAYIQGLKIRDEMDKEIPPLIEGLING